MNDQKSRAWCTDCDDFTSDKEYFVNKGAGVANGQIVCKNCEKRGGHVLPPDFEPIEIIDDDQADDPIDEAEPIDEKEPIDQAREELEEVQEEEDFIKIDTSALFNEKKVKNVTKQIQKAKDDKADITLDISADDIKEFYTGLRETYADIERAFRPDNQSKIYESKPVKALFNISSGFLSDISKKFKFSRRALKLGAFFGNVIISIPALIMGLSNIRSSQDEEQQESFESDRF